jgi:transposase
MLQPVVRRTWAPKGHTPQQYSWDRHDRVSVISALTVAPRHQRLGLYFQIYRHNIQTPEVIEFLVALHRRLRRPLLVVLDRWSVHRSAIRQLQQEHRIPLEIEWLPAYAPDLNPVEQVSGHSKYADLANYIPHDVDYLTVEVQRSLATMRATSPLLRSFCNHAGLTL